jgi:hypothetical protein
MRNPKKNFRNLLFILVVLLLMSLACQALRPASNETDTANGQPDLVADGWVWMPLGGLCAEEYLPLKSKVCVENRGDAAAGSFLIRAGEDTNWSVPGLEAGAQICYESEVDLSGAMITVDARNEVKETDENNNDWFIPVPTPPVRCTPVPDEPQIPPETVEPPQEADVSYQGVSFSFDPSLASSITPETIPADSEAGVAEWNSPEYYQFTLNGYPLQDTFHTPRIMVFPVDAFIAINPVAEDTITQLSILLVDQPTAPESIPFLPVFNAGQFMQAQVKYLDFQNGSGVRFLTQYGQDVWPVNNHDLFYTFQGITSDRQYYISAILPVAHPSLPDPDSVTMDDAFYNNFTDYVIDIESQLSAKPEDSFSPVLSLLDAMIQSILIAP